MSNSSRWLAIGSILIIAAGLALIVLPGVTGAPPTPSPTPTTALNIPDPEIARVSPADAKAAYDAKSAVFVDVRDVGSYQASHIEGALSIPLADLPNRLNELKSTDWIITYCT